MNVEMAESLLDRFDDLGGEISDAARYAYNSEPPSMGEYSENEDLLNEALEVDEISDAVSSLSEYLTGAVNKYHDFLSYLEDAEVELDDIRRILMDELS